MMDGEKEDKQEVSEHDEDLLEDPFSDAGEDDDGELPPWPHEM
jgi:hypothetical protein